VGGGGVGGWGGGGVGGLVGGGWWAGGCTVYIHVP